MEPPSGIAGIVAGRVGQAESVIEWAVTERKLSRATLEALGVATGTVFFPDLGRKSTALFFKYATGWKARAVPGKAFVAGGGFKASFWNLEMVLRSDPAEIYITEGELDALALVEAGVPADRVLSVPTGAKLKPADEPQAARGYAYVDEALRVGLKKVRKIIWCGDEDEPGYALRGDMVRLFGAARFYFVSWPEGCKDACDVLRTEGRGALYDRVNEGSLPWPADGIYRLNELPEPAAFNLWSPGFPEWESKVKLAPRTLSVVTGHPGNGKTALWTQIWFQVLKQYSLIAFVCSFETRAKPHLRRHLRSLFSGKLERDMDSREVVEADEWINDRYLFGQHPDQRPTLQWFLDTAEVAIVRYGAKVVQLDPWNRLEASRDVRESETDYIGRCLRELYAFATDLNCHVQIIAHPAKREGRRRSDVPTLEDISGSKHWDNMPDQGFVVHRPDLFKDKGVRKTDAVLYHRKARFDELGYPCQLMLDFDLQRWSYRSTDYRT